MRKILAGFIVLAFLVLAVPISPASATIGTQQECYVNDVSGNFITGMDSNDGEAQTFTPSSSYSVGAIKWNAYRNSLSDGFDSLTLSVHPLSGGLPDLNTTLGSESWNTELLPIYDSSFPHSNNIFNCSSEVTTGQLVEFTTPFAVTGGTEYAIVVRGTTGSVANDMLLPYTSGDNTYAGGNYYECNVPTSCSLLTPATWDATGADVGFAVYDAVFVTELSGVADTWLENFLSDFLGLGTETGKLMFAFGFAAVLFVAMLLLRVHFLAASAFTGFLLATATLALLVPTATFLAGFALAGVAVLVGAAMTRSTEEG